MRLNWLLFILFLLRASLCLTATPSPSSLFELGRRVAETDPAGKTTAFGYDTLGRMTAVTNALGYVTSYGYDELGQQISQTDANQHTTTFEYDALGRRVKRTLPGNQVETYAYNIGGLLTNKTDFNGYATAYQYDGMNRLVAKVPEACRGEYGVTYAYDHQGLRTNMIDASGVTAYAYDDHHRLVQKTRTWAGAGFSSSLHYAYDVDGSLTNIVSSDPNGANVSYEYDTLSRLSAVNDAHLGRTAYQYDDVGNLQGCTYPNSVHTEHQYDALNRLTNLASAQLLTPLANYAYTVGATGNRLTASEQLYASALNAHSKTINRLYAYDDVYRLTAETITGTANAGSASYSYDPVGNRQSRDVVSLPLGQQSFAFDANDRLSTDSYDNNGNTLVGLGFGQSQADQYDFENRLVTRHTPSATITVQYDGDGNRVSKTVATATNTVKTFYVVDDLNPTGYAQVLEEYTSQNAAVPVLQTVYTYGHTLISQDRWNGGHWSASFYGYDGHNNVRYLSDAHGNVTDTYDYDAFGNLIAVTGTTENLYLFTGEQYDPDLGLYYLRARYHNTDTGRFWNMDSYEGSQSDPSSLHKYTYCGNNPANGSDPSGHSALSEMMVTGAISGIVGNLVSSFVINVWASVHYDVNVSDMYGTGDVVHDVWTGAVGGAVGGAIAKGAMWAIGKYLPEVSDILLVYVCKSNLLSKLYVTLENEWIELDAAIIQGSEAAIQSASSALATARSAIAALGGEVDTLAAELGFGSVASHIGGAFRECTADVAHLLVNHYKIAGREKLVESLRKYAKNNNISNMPLAIGKIRDATGLDAVESTSWGTAEPGAYAVFTGQHVVFGEVLKDGTKMIIDLSSELGQREFKNGATDFLNRAEAVLFAPPK